MKMTQLTFQNTKGQGKSDISLIMGDHFQNVTTFGVAVQALILARTKKEIVTATLIASMS